MHATVRSSCESVPHVGALVGLRGGVGVDEATARALWPLPSYAGNGEEAMTV